MQTRGKFSDKYAQPVQPWKKASGARLMDCNLSTWAVVESPVRPSPPCDGEFLVLDKVRQEIGYFQWPEWFDSARIEQMIEGHFGVSSVRLFDRVWVV